MEVLFWIGIGLVFYTYLGYGFLVSILVGVKRLVLSNPKMTEEVYEPDVTLVVPAYNEEDYIVEKAANSLALDYPKDKLRILFITDGSSDKTKELLETVPGVEVLHEDKRGGKSAAENRAMKFVTSPIVVFCDANTTLNKDCIRQLVRHYRDDKVGGVAGEKRISQYSNSSTSGAGEGLYWRYESFLKKKDSELYTVVGAAGELISFRSSLVEDLEEDTILDDFVQSLRICQKGFRVKYEPNAQAVEMASQNVAEEFKRKVRIAAGGWQAMSRLKSLMNPFNNTLLAFQYVSHRVLRWSISAFALPFVFILNCVIVLRGNDFSLDVYDILMLAQLCFYTMALVGWYFDSKGLKIKLLYVPYYFSMMNYAVFAGFFRWTKGAQKATWEKASRMKMKTK